MSRRHPGLLLIAACLMALALRVLVPVGWMPASGDNAFVLSLCSGTTLPADPLVPPGDSSGTACDYALALGPVLLSAALLLPALALPLLSVLLPLPARARLRRHRPRPPGQGPPRT